MNSTISSSDKRHDDAPKKLKTWQRRIEMARKKHRPGLKNWAKDLYGKDRAGDFLALRNPINYQDSRYRIKPIPRIDASSLSVEEFLNHYEKQSIPIIIQNIPTTEGWKAVTHNHWSWSNLLQQYGNEYFKCGEDDDGYKINIRLKYFLRYLQHNTDDSPLYIFDSAYADVSKSKPKPTNQILSDYQVPSYFPYDLFETVGESRRPPYRWFLVGPQRSGSSIHIDPLGTSAWNTLISGRKRWILFPPGLKKDFVKGKAVMLKGEDDEAINYFVDIFPRMKQQYLSTSLPANSEYAHLWAYEFIQEPGETIFVPSGWWHTVLNLEDTVAITQNYCSYNNFDACWRETRKGRKKMCIKWLKQLATLHPTLYQRAWELNRLDGFVLEHWKDPIPAFPLNSNTSNTSKDSDDAQEIHKKKSKDEKKKKHKKKQKTQDEVAAIVTSPSLTETSTMTNQELKNLKKKRSYDSLQETTTETSHESMTDASIRENKPHREHKKQKREGVVY